jgi:hypothetical protein
MVSPHCCLKTLRLSRATWLTRTTAYESGGHAQCDNTDRAPRIAEKAGWAS